MTFYAAYVRYAFPVLLSISECCCKPIRYYYWKRTTDHAAYYKLISYFKLAELALVDYFVMREAIGIVATLFVSFYYSRKQM
jgi:hypothetical protein